MGLNDKAREIDKLIYKKKNMKRRNLKDRRDWKRE